MKAKKVLIGVVLLSLTALFLLAACDETTDNESAISGEQVSQDEESSNSSDNTANSDSENEISEEESLEPIVNEPTEYLSVIGCTLTDKNCFVIVGNCEEGAVITATTKNQTVTTETDRGFYSVRLKKEDTKTRVSIEAKGEITETFTLDAQPKIPTSDMWPIVAGNGYDFFFQKMMPDYMQTNVLSNNQISTLTNKVSRRVNNLKTQLPHTEIIYMIVPSKASVYPERVPEDYRKGSGKSRLEQVNEALETAGAKVINLLEVFDNHKDDEYKTYWKTDSHWTDYGAFVAYTELFNYIKQKFPEAAPRKPIEFNFKADFYNGGDMIYYIMMDQNVAKEYNWHRLPKFELNKDIKSISRYRAENYLMYSEDITPEIVFETGRNKLPNLYVMRDSYSAQIFDILADRGNKTVYKSMWSFTFNINDIKRHSPDYIVYILSEWNIDAVISG